MENKLARFFKSTGPARFFVPLGLILIIFGVIMMRMTPEEYGETTGVITDVSEYTDMSGDTKEQKADIEFDYTVNGTKYSGSFSGLSVGEYKIGDQIPVYYNPDDPESISNTKDTGIISTVMIAVGAAALIFGVLATVKTFKKNRALDDQIKGSTGYSEVYQAAAPAKEELANEYYVSFDGVTLKPGYLVEDRMRNVIYKMTMTKQAMVGNRVFTFTDCVSGFSEEHNVGHTVTQQYNNEIFSTSSWFKFDGKNIWDILHDRGIRIDTDLHSIFPRVRYTLSLNGSFLATVETASKYVHEEDEAEHKVNIPVGRYFYRIWTDATDLDLILLTVFAISETEQAVVE